MMEYREARLPFGKEWRQITDLAFCYLKALYDVMPISIHVVVNRHGLAAWQADQLIDGPDLGNGNLGVTMRATDGLDSFGTLVFSFGMDGQDASVTERCGHQDESIPLSTLLGPVTCRDATHMPHIG